ncbi:hypothetical protein [Epilithonimonas sp.]|uniref:hypothetical protein n=1 Tax=Epilithonimonas sp. TaxID=2894511 RepID=UPI0028A06322|nr:hypothetical protein [Epilithonimonas sp.]
MKKIYIWLLFTVFIGLIPILARFFTVKFFMLTDVVLISPVDIIVFGIVLHVSIINEINRYRKDEDWRLIALGLSVLFIIGYAVLLAIAICSESKNIPVNTTLLLISTKVLATISFIKCLILLYQFKNNEMEVIQ